MSIHRSRRTASGRRRALLPVMAGVLLALSAASPVSADVELEASDPADGAALETSPQTIVLEFSGPLVEDKSSFALRDAGGTIGKGRVSPDDDTVMTLGGLDLAPGEYEVRWTAGSEDGHIVRDTLTFTVLELTPPPATPAPSPSAAAPSATPDVIETATPQPSLTSSPTAAPNPSPGTDTGTPAASMGDVLLPIVVGLILVGVVGFLVLRRGRAA